MASIEFARNILGKKDANSTEMNANTKLSNYQFNGRAKNSY